MSSSRRVLIVDNSLDPSIYRPITHWGRHLDCKFETVSPPTGAFPAELKPFSHVILTGSEASILDDEAWIVRECELVRDIAEAGIPLLASCFAHQLIVLALSGKRFVRCAVRPEFGWLEALQESPAGKGDPVFGALPQSFSMFSAHFDEVFPLPRDWQRLAFSIDCANAAIKWKKGPIWGIQHHPEINFHDGEILLTAIPERMPGRRRIFERNLYPDHRDSGVIDDIVKAFLAV